MKLGDNVDGSVIRDGAALSVTLGPELAVLLAREVGVDEGGDEDTSVELSVEDAGSEVSVENERSEVSRADAGNVVYSVNAVTIEGVAVLPPA